MTAAVGTASTTPWQFAGFARPGKSAPNWPFPELISDGTAIMEGTQVKFQIGDQVRDGFRVGTVTDVGTVLIQVKTTEGRLRVVCPWELVKTRVG
jgi:hypothetical protein